MEKRFIFWHGFWHPKGPSLHEYRARIAYDSGFHLHAKLCTAIKGDDWYLMSRWRFSLFCLTFMQKQRGPSSLDSFKICILSCWNYLGMAQETLSSSSLVLYGMVQTFYSQTFFCCMVSNPKQITNKRQIEEMDPIILDQKCVLCNGLESRDRHFFDALTHLRCGIL